MKLANRIFFAFLGLGACLLVDGSVSLLFKWPGVIRLGQGLLAGSSGGAVPDHSAVWLLIILAVLLYVWFGWALGQWWQVHRAYGALSEAWRASALSAGSRVLSAVQLRPAAAADPTGLVEAALSRHADVLDAREKDKELRGPLEAILGRLEPRDLLGFAELATSLNKGLTYEARTLARELDALDGIGELAVVLGLAGTVVGLIAAGGNLADIVLVGMALQAALIKTAAGMTTRALCLAVRQWYTYRVGAGEHAVERLAAGAFTRIAYPATVKGT